MRVAGLISGTSHDGIDLAIVDFQARGDLLEGVVRHTDTVPYSPALRERLMRALPPAAVPMSEVCALDTLIGQEFAAAVRPFADGLDLICSHGQTVYHWTDGAKVLGTLQIGQPAWIAEDTGVPVVADVRTRDVAAGGQGAPLVALMDQMLLSGLPGCPAALNLGGIANLTVPRPRPLAYDVGPANALIDAAAMRASGGRRRYDEGGRLAAAGRVDGRVLARLLEEPYYALPPPKTTGKELFNDAYLDGVPIGGPDLVATVTALTAETVAAEVRRHGIGTLVVSGGGCANQTLMAMLAERLPTARLTTSEEFGAPSDAKEAIAFALIGWLTVHGLPGNAAGCTGAAGGRLLGAVIPGAGPLRLPAPIAEPPRALSLIAHPEGAPESPGP